MYLTYFINTDCGMPLIQPPMGHKVLVALTGIVRGVWGWGLIEGGDLFHVVQVKVLCKPYKENTTH